MQTSGFSRLRMSFALALLLCAALSVHVSGEEKLRSLQYVWVHPRTSKSGENLHVVRKVVILDGNLSREEFEFRKVAGNAEGEEQLPDPFIVIEDAAAGKKICIEPHKKRCTVIKQQLRTTLNEGPHWVKVEPQKDANFFRCVRLQVPSDARQLPETTIDGRQAIGFVEVDARGPESWTTTWWVDPKTNVPFRINRSYRVDATDRDGTESVQRDIVVNPPLERSLFNTDPPDGYEVVVQDGED